MRDDTRDVKETVERFLESTLDSVDQAEELASGAALRAGFDEDELMKIGMAIREAMVNAVVHGNRYSQNKRVRFELSLTSDRFTVVIADEGSGFDFAHIPDPLAPENLLRTSGRGIFLMRSFMDSVDLRHLESGGTEVTLVKKVESK
jgi:serine/threonine-protein kinase RsbW